MSARFLLDEHRALLRAAAGSPERWAALHLADAASILTADDVLIVVDMQNDFLPGGAFGVAEGDAAVAPIATLIARFAAAGARVFATRDYHPVNHCSFASHGGPFPPHCVQNTNGSFLCEGLQAPLRAAGATIVFKGFSKDIDSFGALPYADEQCGARVTSTGGGHCGSVWTGSFILFSSTGESDINAPPDVMSVLDRVPLAQVLAPAATVTGRIFVVGLAMDYCVLDTACNAARLGFEGRTYILPDATRAAHLPGIGAHGSGFLSSPASIVASMEAGRVRFAGSAE